MDNRVMMKTTTQRQIERAAEQDLDLAETAMHEAKAKLGIALHVFGLDSPGYRDAFYNFDRARAIHADALNNLEKTRFEGETR